MLARLCRRSDFLNGTSPVPVSRWAASPQLNRGIVSANIRLLMHSVLLAASALAPVSALAQQVSAPQSTSSQEQAQLPPVQAATEEKQKQPAETQTQTEKDKVISGMSILGNQEAPKSLVIVPWKSSEIGNSMNVSTLLDDSRQPVDKEVFMRMLNYYEVRSNLSRQEGAAADGRNTAASDKNTAAQLDAASQRRKR